MIDTLPRFQYGRRGGVLVTQIAREPFGRGFHRRDVEEAIEPAGLTADDCDNLIFGFERLPFLFEEDQPQAKRKRGRMEHVIARRTPINNLPIYKVDYYERVITHTRPTHHVLTKTTELIYGLGGVGILQIIPTRKSKDAIVPIRKKAKNVVIKWSTLVVLPPNVQINY